MSELSTLQQLSDDITQGNLKLKVHRDKLDEAVKGIQDLIDELQAMGNWINQVAYVDGFGGFQMGIDLAKKFSRKGSGEESIRQRLDEVVHELKAAQDVIRKAAIAYAQTDDEYRDVLQGIQP
ncbi:hypothetical protein [Nocardia vermiculata]|uniref:WXG100 family type VII secretion target n=1 Tax=Nocardia vermiculata TaxID=257274 RepID=A0A846YCJ4_9NOCA|nr:hypothetical protein [Nocardia vermiculata]NKY54529.1 hypothetical protein [Nocardia vermiculata]